MDQGNQIKAGNKELKELLEWMLDSYSIREQLKILIATREKMDAMWLLKSFGDIAKPDDRTNLKRF